MSYRTEFPDFPADLWGITIPEGAVDTSWRNDACPSFWFKAKHRTLWVDHIDPDKREFQGMCRFSVTITDAEGCHAGTVDDAFVSDNWDEVVAHLAALPDVADAPPVEAIAGDTPVEGIQPSRLTSKHLDEACAMDNLDDAARHLQDICGITDGGIAAQCLGDLEDIWGELAPMMRRAHLQRWLAYELVMSL